LRVARTRLDLVVIDNFGLLGFFKIVFRGITLLLNQVDNLEDFALDIIFLNEV